MNLHTFIYINEVFIYDNNNNNNKVMSQLQSRCKGGHMERSVVITFMCHNFNDIPCN